MDTHKNGTDIKDYKEETLNSLGIYELRELARRVGVPSPTTKKRDLLEKDILMILKGDMNPVNNSSQRGRPPKTITNVEKYFEIFVPKEFIETTVNNKRDHVLNDVLRFEKNPELDDIIIVIVGILRKTTSNYFYYHDLKNKEVMVYVPDVVVKKYSLEEGDKITSEARKMISTDYFMVSEIREINSKPPKTNRNLVDFDDVILTENHIEGTTEKIFEGNKILYVTEAYKEGLQLLREKTKILSKNHKVVYLATNISICTKLILEKDFDGDFLYSTIDDNPYVHYDAILNTYNYVKMLMREGEKVILVLYDIVGIMNSLQNYFMFENGESGFQESFEATRIVKKLYNIARCLVNNGSCSVFSYCLQLEKKLPMYSNDLLKDSDFVFDNKNF